MTMIIHGQRVVLWISNFVKIDPLVQECTTWGEQESIQYFKHPNYGIIKACNDWKAKDEIYSLLDQAESSVKHVYGTAN